MKQHNDNTQKPEVQQSGIDELQVNDPIYFSRLVQAKGKMQNVMTLLFSRSISQTQIL